MNSLNFQNRYDFFYNYFKILVFEIFLVLHCQTKKNISCQKCFSELRNISRVNVFGVDESESEVGFSKFKMADLNYLKFSNLYKIRDT